MTMKTERILDVEGTKKLATVVKELGGDVSRNDVVVLAVSSAALADRLAIAERQVEWATRLMRSIAEARTVQAVYDIQRRAADFPDVDSDHAGRT